MYVGKKSKVNNYCLVCLLSVIGKILGKPVSSTLVDHFRKRVFLSYISTVSGLVGLQVFLWFLIELQGFLASMRLLVQ